MRNNIILSFAILFIALFSFDLNAKSQENPIHTENSLEENVPLLINNILSSPKEEGFEVSWMLDYDKYQELKKKGYTISIKYDLKKKKSGWKTVRDIPLNETNYTFEKLSGGETYAFSIGASNGKEEFWSDINTVTTEKGWGLFRLLVLIGSLGMFMYGMKIMSEGLQRAAGARLRHLLGSMTSNRLKGVLTGFGVTALVQSSSVTTVMTVSFVNAGLLTLTQSVGMMMGANIGTTVTGWIVNIFGFEVNLGPYALVLIAIALPMLFIKNPKIKAWSNAIIGFSLLFMGLGFLKATVPQLDQDSALVQFFVEYNNIPYISTLLFVLFGTLITVIVQSSSAAMALTMTLVATGIIPFEVAAAMILGENVGTTITAGLAATIGNVHAKRSARINTLFNLFGVTWAILLFPFLLRGIEHFMVDAGLGSPFENAKVYGNTGLVILHSAFNISNTLLLIWFVPTLVRIAERTVKSKGGQDEEFRLDYIGTGYMSTPNLSLLEAKKELSKFGELTSRMSEFAKDLLFEKSKKKQHKLVERIAKYEEITDQVEVEIANYLNKISESGSTTSIAARIRGMNSIAGNLERIGDIFYQISKNIERKNEEKIVFTPRQRNHIRELFALIDEAFITMCENLKEHSEDVSLDKANKIEKQINKKRNEMKEEYLESLSKDEELHMQNGVVYSNIFEALERVGDHIINVSEGVVGKV